MGSHPSLPASKVLALEMRVCEEAHMGVKKNVPVEDARNLPCPFCASTLTEELRIAFKHAGNPVPTLIATHCTSCGAIGPPHYLRLGGAQTLDMWNTRLFTDMEGNAHE